MIVMRLELKNFLAFDEISMDFSYPKKITQTPIEFEYLKTKPNFRYKKINILMGSNATGKTSIGKSLLYIFNFIVRKRNVEYLRQYMRQQDTQSSFLIDFVINDEYLYRVECEFTHSEILKLEIKYAKIATYDSYEKVIDKLVDIDPNVTNILDKLDLLPELGWYFSFPQRDENRFFQIHEQKHKRELDIKVMKNILMTLDTSIENVSESKEFDNGIIVKTACGSVLIQNNELMQNNPLSSGTEDGLEIAYIISSIKQNSYGFYYCDEKLTYIQSDIEKALLRTMVETLHEHDQLFFTTHNLDILDEDYPSHSYMFLRKGDNGIEIVDPEKELENTKGSIKHVMKKNLFRTIKPDLKLISELKDIQV